MSIPFCRRGGMRIDIGRHHMARAGASRGERENAAPGTDLGDTKIGQIKPADESSEKFAGQKKPRMEHRRWNAETKAGGTGGRGPRTPENEVIGEAMDQQAKQPPRQAWWGAWAGQSIESVKCQ